MKPECFKPLLWPWIRFRQSPCTVKWNNKAYRWINGRGCRACRAQWVWNLNYGFVQARKPKIWKTTFTSLKNIGRENIAIPHLLFFSQLHKNIWGDSRVIYVKPPRHMVLTQYFGLRVAEDYRCIYSTNEIYQIYKHLMTCIKRISQQWVQTN